MKKKRSAGVTDGIGAVSPVSIGASIRKAVFCFFLLSILFSLIRLSALSVSADGATIEMNRGSSLTIRYRESDDENEAVSGAEFTIMRAAVPEEALNSYSVSLRYRAVYKQNGKAVYLDSSATAKEISESVLAFYASYGSGEGYQAKAVTDANGTAYASGLPPGVYLVRETKAAKEHLASASFLVTLPYSKELTVQGRRTMEWCYEGYAEPKSIPCGDLVISKYIRGTGADAKKQFHFVVALNVEGSFHCLKSDGSEGSIKNGSVIALKAGQSAVIDTIPAGTAYQVKEKEANKDGYKTSASGASGRISRTSQSRASFLNEKQTKAAAKKTTGTPTGKSAATPGRTGGSGKTAPVRTGDRNSFPGWILVLICSLFAGAWILGGMRKNQ